MYKLVLYLCCLVIFSCNTDEQKEKDSTPMNQTATEVSDSTAEDSKNGAPETEEAKKILKEWFDEFKTSVGGYNYDAESFDFLSVSGDTDKAQINFKWTGTWHPPSTPDNTSTSRKVIDEKKTLFLVKSQGKWRVDGVREAQ